MDASHLFPDIPTTLTEELLSLLSPEGVVAPEHIAEKYHSDWSQEQAQCPAGLLLPKSTQELSTLMALCHKASQPVVIQGGLTGLTGGSTPQPKELAVSLENICGVESIDRNAMTLTVKSGTTLSDIHRQLEGTGLTYGVDYGARNQCQIGGNVATNAGGTQVIRFGMTRAQVLGLEAVLADGAIVDSMNPLLKNNAGYDIKQLFIGSEGTLGIITRLVLRLFPETTSRCTGLFALKDFQHTLILLNLCRSLFGESLQTFEVMWKDFYQAAAEAANDRPLDPDSTEAEIYVLVEIRGRDTDRDEFVFSDLFEQCLAEDVLLDGAIAETEDDANRLWNIRFAVKSLLKSLAPLANFDIGIPINLTQSLVTKTKTALLNALPEVKAYYFGHIGDGNLHLIASCQNEQQVRQVYDLLYPICVELGATTAAEHGIGMERKAQLSLSRTSGEIDIMKALKRTLDPKGILNPGRVFDL